MTGLDSSDIRIRLAIQGGGMRVAYALGAMRSLRARAGDTRLMSVSCSSAGATAALAYLCHDIENFVEVVFRKLASRRFINPWRMYRISDIDYLVDEVVMPMVDLDAIDQSDAPEIWVSLVDAKDAMVRYRRLAADNVRELLRATMAIPVLYGRSVPFDGRRYIDGGVGDALPLMHALLLAQLGDVIIPVATKPIEGLASHNVGRLEKVVLLLDRRVSNPVRHLLLAPNPLVEVTIQAFSARRVAGVAVYGCEPSDSSLVFSRTNTDVSELVRLAEVGRSDMEILLRDLRANAPVGLPVDGDV